MPNQTMKVQGTNDSSIISKKSMVSHGYFPDEFVSLMTSKSTRRAPLINRGYYIRAKAIDFAIQNFLDTFSHDNFQIVCLGAGFDTTYFRLKSQKKLENCVYVEIDFFDVARAKANLISSHEKLKTLITEDELDIHADSYLVINTPNFKIVGTDMAHTNVLEACLRACFLSSEVPTLFISECVITYMSKKGTSNLINLLSRNFELSTFVLYEQVYPDDSFGRFMCSHFKKLGSPLRCIDFYKTKEDQIERFHSRGWEQVELVDMNEFYFNFVPEKERQRVEELEVFDEYEEWHLKCSHYFILVAKKKPSTAVFPKTYNELATEQRPILTISVSRLPVACVASPTSIVKAHTLAACLLPLSFPTSIQQCLVRVGGYGQDPLGIGHTRLTSVTMVSLIDGEAVECRHVFPQGHEFLDSGIYSSMCALNQQDFIIFGGRTSPLRASASLIKLSFTHLPVSSATSCETTSKPGTIVDRIQPVCHVMDGCLGDEFVRPSARWRHCSAVYCVQDRAFMLVYGGRTLKTKALEDTWIYDVTEGTWTQPEILSSPGPLLDASLTPLSSPLSSSPHCTGPCCLLLIGGRGSNLVPSASVWKWCGRERSWTLLPVSLPSPRFSHTVHLVRPGLVVVVGGVMTHHREGSFRGSPAERVCFLDLERNTAVDVLLDMSPLKNDLLMPHNHASVLTSGGDLIILGGGGNCFSFGTHLNAGLFTIPLSSISI